ncbi:MAG: hypothetical protein WCD53_00760, partial [Microcoleus sp.]
GWETKNLARNRVSGNYAQAKKPGFFEITHRLRNPVSSIILVGRRKIWQETGFLGITHSLRNPVSTELRTD